MAFPLCRRGQRLLLGGLLMLVMLIVPRPSAAWQEEGTLSPDDYWELVAATEAAVDAARGLPAAEQQAILAPLADRWAAARRVRLDGDTQVDLSTRWLVESLRTAEPDLEALASRLEALQAARSAWPDALYGPEEASQLRGPLDEILARPEFQWQEAEPTLLERFWQALLRALFDLLPTGQGNQFLNYALTGLGALVLLTVLLFAARSLFGSLTATAEQKEGIHPATTLTAEEALRQAQTLSQGGDYRNAVRYLYLSTLFLLDERGVLRYDRSRTNREYLRSVAGRPELAATLRSVVDIFDQTWYGFRPLDAETYAAYEAAVNDLKKVRRQT